MWVEGEVLEFTPRHSSRVQFFTLTDVDEKMSMNCKAFNGVVPKDFAVGNRIVLQVKPDFWVGNGSLSLQVNEIRHVGIGDILVRLEQLRRKLASEGLFNADRKKPLPFLPRRIGLICGSNAKAKDDVVVNARLRWPDVDFEIREVKVQGNESPRQVMAALAELDDMPDIDVIIIARGGGSVEDLLPFSDEQLVRAAAAARTPIVTAIGHEADRPIIDDVADYRASTPTDAAKRTVPDVMEEKRILIDTLRRGRLAIDRRLEAHQGDLDSIRSRPVLANPEQLIGDRVENLTMIRERLGEVMERMIDRAERDVESLARQVRNLSPQSILNRGYSVLRTKDGVVRDAGEITEGQRLEALLASGRLGVEVFAVKEENHE